MKNRVEANIGGRTYTIETGEMARQADGAVVVRSGDTMVLVTVCSAKEPKPDIDFLPLTVDFQERMYAAGRIPGGFFKRETRPTEKETLTSRLIDRPLRPLFPEGYGCETQIIAQVISAEPDVEGDVLAITGASAALAVSDVPFHKLIAGVRVCRVDGQLLANPGANEIERADLEILVAGTEQAIVMVEGGAQMVSEDAMMDALDFAHSCIKEFIALQKSLQAKVPVVKRVYAPAVADARFLETLKRVAAEGIKRGFAISDKKKRGVEMKAYRDQMLKEVMEKETAANDDEKKAALKHYKSAWEDLKHEIMRQMILKEHKRIDGRGMENIRPITCQVGVLPRAHGSALFTRGETQALVSVTLGAKEDEQRIEGLQGSNFRQFLLNYNFPPFSVGEVKPLRGPGRREVGHGKLAERAVLKILPDLELHFPYTIRVVSEILESNGSSSMATVCGASLALMDAACQTKAHVAGIAMGLVKEGNDVAVLSDILGDEDHLGDMDFKVCGTREGIASIQMDIKIDGVTRAIMKQALEQAHRGRLHIIGEMEKSLKEARQEISPYAPRWKELRISPARIKDVIGSGGKIIKSIIEQTGAKIDIEDDGRILIFSADPKAMEETEAIIKSLTQEAEIGMIYKGIVNRIADFGAFVEIMPGTDGLIHISQLANERVEQVRDVLKEGDEVLVKVIDVDPTGKVRLSRKAAFGKEVGTVHEIDPSEQRRPPSSGGSRDRGGQRDARRSRH